MGELFETKKVTECYFKLKHISLIKRIKNTLKYKNIKCLAGIIPANDFISEIHIVKTDENEYERNSIGVKNANNN